jgi:hypothetical protein
VLRFRFGYEQFEQFNIDYERAQFRFSPANQRIGAATRDLFLSWYPRPFRPLIRPAIYAMMDDSLIEAFGFPQPSTVMRSLVAGVLKLRTWLLRWLPARRRPHRRTKTRTRTYPEGYAINDLGPSNS